MIQIAGKSHSCIVKYPLNTPQRMIIAITIDYTAYGIFIDGKRNKLSLHYKNLMMKMKYCNSEDRYAIHNGNEKHCAKVLCSCDNREKSMQNVFDKRYQIVLNWIIVDMENVHCPEIVICSNSWLDIVMSLSTVKCEHCQPK